MMIVEEEEDPYLDIMRTRKTFNFADETISACTRDHIMYQRVLLRYETMYSISEYHVDQNVLY
jgi:hypothetical protein